jgi:intergrase/recombinase
MTTDNPKPASSAWDDVKRIAEEVKLKLHLAGMEAKEQWKKFEPKMIELETKVKEKAKDGGEKAYGVVGEQVEAFAVGLRQFAEELRESVAKAKPGDAETTAEAKPAAVIDAAADEKKPETKPD